MKIAVAASGKTQASLVDQRFGRCPYFLIIDDQEKEFEVLENRATQAARGAGISAAQLIVDQGVGAVIAGNFGPKAVYVLSSGGVKLYSLMGLKVKEALKKYKKGELKEKKPDQISFQPGQGQGQRFS